MRHGRRSTRGDRLVCFTDGITEALSPSGDEFGEDRFIERIRKYRREAPERLAAAVLDEVMHWTGGAVQDDATLIVAQGR